MKFCSFFTVLFFIGLVVELNQAENVTSETQTIYDENNKEDVCKTCGKFEYEKNPVKLVDGQAVKLLRYPFYVYLDIPKCKECVKCGASIISQKYILTAAHCVDKFKAEDLKLTIGSLYRDTRTPESKIIDAKKIVLHPDWDKNSDLKLHDIALIEVAPLTYSDNIAKICLAKDNSKKYSEDLARIVGHGKATEDPDTMKDKLQVTPRIEVLSNKKCSERWGKDIEDSKVCSDNSKSAPCDGDHGGPLFLQENGQVTEIGLFSYSEKQCQTLAASVHTRISFYIDWIKSIVSKEVSCI